MVRGETGSQESQTRKANVALPQPATILRFCRCIDCRLWKLARCPLGNDDPDHWRYCADYNGPPVSRDALVVRRPERDHAANAATHQRHTTPPVGPRANVWASVEPVAKVAARTRHGPNVANVGPSVVACQNGAHRMMHMSSAVPSLPFGQPFVRELVGV